MNGATQHSTAARGRPPAGRDTTREGQPLWRVSPRLRWLSVGLLFQIGGSVHAQSLCPELITYRSHAETAPYSQQPGSGTGGLLTVAELDDNFSIIEDLLCKGELQVEDLATALDDGCVPEADSGGWVCGGAKVIVHATDCTAATATSPALCIEIDESPPDLYGCELAAGGVCDTGAEWSLLGGGGAADGVGYDEVLEEGSGLTKRAKVNFIGPDVTCADNGGATRTDCTIADLAAAAHTHDTSTISALDVSADTNLAVTAPIVLTDDTISLNQHAGTNVANDLEEETHASEHETGGADPLTALSAAILTSGTIPAARVGADHIDAITEIASAIKTGVDAKVVTGTAGGTGICAEWNSDGDLVAAVSAAACGSGGTSHTYWSGGTNAGVSNSATSYFAILGVMTSTATETQVRLSSPGVTITPTSFYCNLSASPGAGKSYVITLRDSGNTTDTDWGAAAGCTIADSATSCNDTTGSTIAAGTFLGVSVVPVSSPTSRSVRCVLTFS
jgi:hypothetical protein